MLYESYREDNSGSKEWLVRVRQLSTERQLDLLLYEMAVTRPTDMRFAEVIVEKCSDALPVIFERLRASQSDEDKAHLFQLLSRLNLRCQGIDLSPYSDEIASALDSIRTDAYRDAAVNAYVFSGVKIPVPLDPEKPAR